MSAHNKLRKQLYSSVGPVLLVAMSLATSDAISLAAVCRVRERRRPPKQNASTAVANSAAIHCGLFDISWVNPDRAEYYFADRSNAGIDVIDTQTLTFKRTIGGFVGIKLNAAGTAVNNNISGPDGVMSHGRWLYAGDGDSTLKVIDLNAPTAKCDQTEDQHRRNDAA